MNLALVESKSKFCLPYCGKILLIDCLSSKALQCILETILNKSSKYRIVEKYKDAKFNEQTELPTWNNLWLLKNPTLRATRLKILYRDNFSNVKRFKYGISDTDKCLICGEVETKEHQLLFCRNAVRLWQIIDTVQNNDPLSNCILDCILVSNDLGYEIVKSVIFKLLIQIDWSKDISIMSAILRMKSALIIELKCKSNPRLKGLLEKLDMAFSTSL